MDSRSSASSAAGSDAVSDHSECAAGRSFRKAGNGRPFTASCVGDDHVLRATRHPVHQPLGPGPEPSRLEVRWSRVGSGVANTLGNAGWQVRVPGNTARIRPGPRRAKSGGLAERSRGSGFASSPNSSNWRRFCAGSSSRATRRKNAHDEVMSTTNLTVSVLGRPGRRCRWRARNHLSLAATDIGAGEEVAESFRAGSCEPQVSEPAAPEELPPRTVRDYRGRPDRARRGFVEPKHAEPYGRDRLRSSDDQVGTEDARLGGQAAKLSAGSQSQTSAAIGRPATRLAVRARTIVQRIGRRVKPGFHR